MGWLTAAVERAMKRQEVILRALSGALTWLQAADILGIHPRSLRRWRARYAADQMLGLYDRRQLPSPRKAPVGELQRILRLYQDRYRGFNVRHFHHVVRREHGVTLSYSFVRLALQEAGLVRKGRARGRHRRRREPRPRFGELLHLDGSPHEWLALCPGQRQTLIAVLDDATKRLLYAQLWPVETAAAVMAALGEVCTTVGLPMAPYTDRAGWAFHTPQAGGPVDRDHLTHVGRALARLGIEHIGAYSPQARGRGERLNRTLQDRLVNELRVARITTLEAANAYLRERFMPDYNATFTRAPADPTSAFMPLGDVDLQQILCAEEPRVVGPDNVVSFDGVPPCHSPSSPAAPRVRGFGSSCAATSTATTRSGAGPSVSGAIPPAPSWSRHASNAPPPGGSASWALMCSRRHAPRRAPPSVAASAPACPSAPDFDGQITCQNRADISLVNNRRPWRR